VNSPESQLLDRIGKALEKTAAATVAVRKIKRARRKVVGGKP
jgi:hypothetical protein